ncbi:ABC transporter ATP-binding protein [Arcanobacterium haemolyticum]|nr:ABC transporter ATP-binding protein [Arcanobacterium haemolyticum]
MGDVVEFRDVTVTRSGHNILDSLDWSVNDGERWVILGPNGAGKTTTIQLAAGRIHPTQGSVSIIGERLGRVDINELRPLVGVASSATDALIPDDERVLNVVLTAAYGHTARWREAYDEVDVERARELLSQMGVGDLAERQFRTISSGEKKRVGIARALMPNPEVLILDEPTSGLDLGGREALLGTLTTLAFSPAAPVIVLVTHHVEEIPAGFTHALLLREGKMFAAGPIDDVMTSSTLSGLFGLPLEVTKSNGRFVAQAR